MTSSIPVVFNFSSHESDIDITSGKVMETNGNATLSGQFMNCSIMNLLFPKQNNKHSHNILWYTSTLQFCFSS